jgi:hypothetical protein
MLEIELTDVQVALHASGAVPAAGQRTLLEILLALDRVTKKHGFSSEDFSEGQSE